MLNRLSLPMLAALMTAGVLLDMILGETRRWHRLVGFGRLANAIERVLNRGHARGMRGALAWGLAVLPITALAAWLGGLAGAALHVFLLYLCLGLRSLRDHNQPIADALAIDDLDNARLLTARIVSRPTKLHGKAWNRRSPHGTRTTHETLTFCGPAGQPRSHHYAPRARRHHGAR